MNDTDLKHLRLAGAGFVAFALDLYHGQIADTIEDAQKLGQALDATYQQARAEIVEAAAYLIARAGQADQGLTVIGFSLGAFYALDFAAAKPDLAHSVVLFYGTGSGDFSAAKAAYLGHFAEQDEFEPLDNVNCLAADLRSSGHSVDFHVYPGTGHWFFEPDRAQAYNPAAAQLAWERTLEFLKRPSSVAR
jgi:carboxymethylenebutenolidase